MGALPVTDRLTEDTMPTPRRSARSSTFARPMALVASPSTASSAPTAPSSTRTTSFATGGSTLTAPRPRLLQPRSTLPLPPRGRLPQVTRLFMLLQRTMVTLRAEQLLLVLMCTRLPREQPGGWETGGTTGAVDAGEAGEDKQDEKEKTVLCRSDAANIE